MVLLQILALASAASLSAQGGTPGSVVAWGSNTSGQTNVPTWLSGVLTVSAGDNHSLALKTDSTVVGWGGNDSGKTNVPAGLDMVVGISAGAGHSLTLRSDGSVFVWGDNSYSQTNLPAGLNGVIAVSAGKLHSLALKSDGTVAGWGAGGPGQTGYADYGQSTVPNGLTGVTAVAAGAYHSLALKADGTVVAWGAGGPGQTGGENMGQSTVPADLNGVVAIAAGGYHNLALRTNGAVVGWGSNYNGQTNVPPGLGIVVSVAAGNSHSMALKADGTVVAWGYNYYGQTNVPAGLSGVVGIDAGMYYSLALLGASPVVIAGPATQTGVSGSMPVFRSAAAGALPLTYRWVFNATNTIPGAIDPVLRLPNVQASQSGTYTLVVSNSLGSVTSTPANLTVMDLPPTISTPPANCAAWLGCTADFLVTATGSLPLRYQWFRDVTNAVAGATNSALQLTNLQPSQAGQYTVVVTNIFGAVTSAPAGLTFVPATTVPYATEDALRSALTAGPDITLAYDGTITLTNTITIAQNTALDGTGHQAAIGGGNAVRVFLVNSNATLTLSNLTISSGCSTQGGGICNLGKLSLSGVSFLSNTASNSLGAGAGGAIYNAGTAHAISCVFLTNCARGGPGQIANSPAGGSPGQDALGGAIFSQGILNADRCAFAFNCASGGEGGSMDGGGRFPGGIGGLAGGGAIGNSGSLGLARSTLVSNVVTGGKGGGFPYSSGGSQFPSKAGNGGWGNGAAVFNSGVAQLAETTFSGNSATGGVGGLGFPQMANFSTPGGAGGSGGAAVGGVGGPFNAVNCVLAFNSGQGGSGGSGGSGYQFAHNIGPGGPGGAGGNGWGVLRGGGSLINCTIAYNAGISGGGGAGGPGQPPGASGSSGMAGGAVSGGAMINTVLATNSPGNCSGTSEKPGDQGHNLSSDDSCNFSNTGSLTNTDPRLGPLANNGGSTWTMALLPGSPAIDAGDTSAAPPTDQRGFPRPAGNAADIGAYELVYSPLLRANPPQAGAIGIQVFGTNGQNYRLLTSPDLSHWTPAATNQIGSEGTRLFYDDATAPFRYYRLAIP